MNSHIDEDKLLKTVELQLKKEGTFDKIRKQATEKLAESDALKKLDTETKAKIGGHIKHYSTTMNKEQLQKLVKNCVEDDARLKFEISRQTRQELEQDWIKDILTQDYNEKVAKELEQYR